MLATLLGEAYGVEASNITPMTMGSVNRNFLVETADGAWALKQYAGVYGSADVLRSCELQVRLRGARVPVPAIRPNQQGELVTETPDGRFVLSEFVRGRQYERCALPAAAARSMGQTLGRLHQALAGEAHPYRFPDRTERLERLKGLLGLAEARRSESQVDADACLILREKIEALAAWREPPTPAPGRWVHGDYQEANVIFGPDDQVVAVIDFDNLRIRPRGLEVMRALAFSFDVETQAPYDFFAGYAEVSGVGADEVARWASDWTYYNLTGDWPIAARYRDPQNYDPRWDRFIVYRPNWWLVHHTEVAERLLRVLSESTGRRR